MAFKLGLKPFVPDERDALFANFKTSEPIPKPPISFGYANLLPTDIGMDGNDAEGDCAPCAAAHGFMLLDLISGKKLPPFSAKSVLKFYSEVTGYVPGDPSTDQGTDYREMLTYLRKTGMKDDAGVIHKIGAFALIEKANLTELDEALFLFGHVFIGVDLPDSAQTQFGDGKPWTVVKGSPIDGGHAIGGIQKVSASQYLFTTWGAKQPVSSAWVKKYMNQAWAVVTPEELKSGKSPQGYDLAQLDQYVTQIAA